MDDFQAYDLMGAFQSGIKTARRTGEARFIVQTAMGYQLRKELGLALYRAFRINADGSIEDACTCLEDLKIPA